MQIVEKRWGWKDAPSAISMALSPTRLLVGMAGLLTVEVLAWALALVWPPTGQFTLAFNIRMLVLLAIVLYVLQATVAVIGRSVYLELEEGEGLTILGSIGFLLRTGIRTGLASTLFLAFLAAMWMLAAVGFLLGRLWSGLGAIMFLPLMVLIVLAGMAGLLAVYGLFIAPGAAGVRKSGALDTMLDTIDMLRGRGVFWGFAVAIIVVVGLGQLLDMFYMLGRGALETGAGPGGAGWCPINLGLVEWSAGLWAGTIVERTGEGLSGWLWAVVCEIFELLCNSFLLSVFAGAGVIGYLVGSEDEVVVVEEKKAAVAPAKEAAKPAEPKKEVEVKAAPAAEKKEEPAAEKRDEIAEQGEPKKPATRKHPPVKKHPRSKEDEGDKK